VVVRLGPRRAERGPDSKFGEAWADIGPSPPLLPPPFPLFMPLEAPSVRVRGSSVCEVFLGARVLGLVGCVSISMAFTKLH
jgi:hypothetical protein